MSVRLKEIKDTALVRGSVALSGNEMAFGGMQPENESCSSGIVPHPNTAADGSRRIAVPVVISMTRYLFAHYRLQMYAYLNHSLRNGMLKRIVGFSFTNRTIHREVCAFQGVNYWRMIGSISGRTSM